MIKEIEVTNFGPLDCLSMKLDKKLSVIVGENNSGKTHIAGAILYAFIGKRAVKNTTSKAIKKSSVKLIIGNNIENCTIHRNYDHMKKYDFSISFVESVEINKLLMKASSYQSYIPVIIDEWNIKPSKLDLNLINEFAHSIGLWKSKFQMIHKIIQETNSTCDGNVYIPSGSSLYILTVINTIAQMFRDNIRVLFMDDFGGMTSNNLNEELFNLLKLVSEKIQVIMTTNHHVTDSLVSDVKTIDLSKLNRMANDSPISFKTSMIPYYPKLIIGAKSSSIKKMNIIRFVEGNIFELEENIETEFKEVKGTNPINSISSVADQYVVAFLNSKEQKKGSVYWGISDDRVIKGVKLSYSQRDKLKCELTNRIAGITPPLCQHDYSIILHQLYSSKLQPIEDKFIVQIITKPFRTKDLFATSKDEFYVKTDSGKRRLKAQELQVEIRRRR